MQTHEVQPRVAAPWPKATRGRRPRGGGRRAIFARRRARLQRPPFFLLWPSLILLLGIIGIPFLISIYTSLTGLDQYTIAHWTSAPFIGLQNYIDGFTKGNVLGASLPGSIWASVSFCGVRCHRASLSSGASAGGSAPAGRILIRVHLDLAHAQQQLRGVPASSDILGGPPSGRGLSCSPTEA
jgi:hypothetical protein